MRDLKVLSPKALTVGALALTLAACGSPKDDGAGATASSAAPAAAESAAPAAAAAAPTTASADAKPAAFAQCAACHSTEPGKAGIGPSLAGAYGAKAGTRAGYDYSDALKASGLSWDDATLDKWLAGPLKLVPGTKMTFAGLADPAQRQAMIAYLKTLK